MDDTAQTQGAHERLGLGEFIAVQRHAAEMSLRQLAERAGISNPYVSQIERGLRKPSAEVLHQLANALHVSAEQLFQRAGILDPDEARPTSVERAIRADPALSEVQKQALIHVYSAFVAPQPTDAPSPTEPTPTDQE